MSLPEIATHEEWLEARKQLLAREKEMTHRYEALNADRRRLPMCGSTSRTSSPARAARRRCSTCSKGAGS